MMDNSVNARIRQLISDEPGLDAPSPMGALSGEQALQGDARQQAISQIEALAQRFGFVLPPREVMDPPAEYDVKQDPQKYPYHENYSGPSIDPGDGYI
jgi:hypothetical protein